MKRKFFILYYTPRVEIAGNKQNLKYVTARGGKIETRNDMGVTRANCKTKMERIEQIACRSTDLTLQNIAHDYGRRRCGNDTVW